MGRPTISDFVVDTIGHCFICMEEMSLHPLPTVVQPGVSSSSTSISTHSMLYVSRYLKIKMTKVFNEEVFVPESLLEKVEMSTLKVSLCEECASWNSRLSELLQKLEKIEIEAASYLKLIHGKLQQAAQDGTSDICSKLAHRCSDSELIRKLEVAETLRKETMERCSQKMNGAQLKVKIQKLSEKDIEILKPNSACNYFESSIRDNSERGLNDVKLETANLEGIWEESEDNNLDDFEERNKNKDSTEGNLSPISEHDSGSDLPDIRKISSKQQKNYIRNSRTGRYECKLCTKTFAFNRGFRTHYQSSHLKIRFKCQICNKEFTEQGNLKTHQNSVHLKLRVKCQFCNTSFSTPNSRRRHIRYKKCEGVKTNSILSNRQGYSQFNAQDPIDTIKFEPKTETNLRK